MLNWFKNNIWQPLRRAIAWVASKVAAAFKPAQVPVASANPASASAISNSGWESKRRMNDPHAVEKIFDALFQVFDGGMEPDDLAIERILLEFGLDCPTRPGSLT
jgi:hypothetical protein